MDAGIACIYQELNLIPHLTVAENIFLGRELRLVNGTFVKDNAGMVEAAARLLEDLGLHFDPRMKVGKLGIGHQQMVEICKAVSTNARLLIMDEPTSSLSAKETEDLFRIIGQLRAEDVTMLLHLAPAWRRPSCCAAPPRCCETGARSPTCDMAEVTVDQIIRLMVGREITDKFPKVPAPRREEALSVEHLAGADVLHDISLKVYAGEVLGLAGLVGSGRTELARAIVGADPIDGGTIRVFGKEVRHRLARDAIHSGHRAPHRGSQGPGPDPRSRTCPSTSPWCAWSSHARFGLSTAARCGSCRRACQGPLDQPARHPADGASPLAAATSRRWSSPSGCAAKARILIFDEPTRGIDVGAKVEVYQLMNQLVKEGRGGGDHLLGDARGAGNGRPDPGHARGPDRG